MATVVFPYLQVYAARGQVVRYYRRGGKRWRLPGDPGSVEFAQAYEAAKHEFESGVRPVKTRATTTPGSFKALFEAFRLSPEYRDKITPESQRHYDRAFAPLIEKYGDKRVATMPRAWVIARRDELAATPRKADHLVAMIRRLMNWAVDHEWRKDNPALRIGTLAQSVKHRAWTDHEIATMTGPEAGIIAGPIIISLYTALRLGDVLSLTPSAYDGECIRITQSKTKRHKNAVELVIPAHPVLRQLLSKLNRSRPKICLRADGEPWKIDHFKKVFAATRKRLGMAPDLHFHGLRGTAASRMAEGGASDQQIGAVTGHLSADMIRHYSSGARQRLLAKGGIDSLPQKAIKPKPIRNR
ncbi:MAG: tyrosine-type recombinase/integrase [Acidocella sp.]|nr:tyrosine-type recombinase/integrase [Acidocella sp.]